MHEAKPSPSAVPGVPVRGLQRYIVVLVVAGILVAACDDGAATGGADGGLDACTSDACVHADAGAADGSGRDGGVSFVPLGAPLSNGVTSLSFDRWRIHRYVPAVKSVAAGEDGFLAISPNGDLLQSIDGETWRAGMARAPLGQSLIATSSGFIAHGGPVPLQHTSSGAAWREEEPPSRTLSGLASDGEILVAYDADARHIWTKPPGSVWEATATPMLRGQLNAFAHARGIWVGVGESGSIVRGLTPYAWENRSLQATELPAFISVAGASAGFVCVTMNGIAFHSADGRQWTKVMASPSFKFSAVAASSKHFLIVGSDPETKRGVAFVSSDGLEWVRSDVPDSAGLIAAATTDELSLVVGEEGHLYSSRVAMSWTRVTPDASAQTQMAASPERLIVAGPEGRLFMTTDGSSWEDLQLPMSGGLTDLVYVAKRFVATGPRGVLSSDDGVAWKEITTMPPHSFTSISYGRGTWLAVASDNKTFKSPNLMAWTPGEPLPADSKTFRIRGNAAGFLAAPLSGSQTMASDDGTAWKQVAYWPVSAVVAGPSEFFVAGAYLQMVMRKDAGWTYAMPFKNMGLTNFTGAGALGEQTFLVLLRNLVMRLEDAAPKTTGALPPPPILRAAAVFRGQIHAAGDQSFIGSLPL